MFDNLSRSGTETNLEWLKSLEAKLTFVQGDVRYNFEELSRTIDKQDVVFHFAAQVAVTTSVTDPRQDFEINALGTLNVLEAARLYGSDPVLFFSSTNKVYGGMEDLKVSEGNGRYSYRDLPYGVSEERPLDFHSPYGCSKGSADQYVRDYARIYGLRTVVFRKSCIYGERQFGNEDQGWVAWFTIAALRKTPLVIYGDGKQVRDVLYVGDLIGAYEAAISHIDSAKGQVYNIGGGSGNTLSLLELMSYLEDRLGYEVQHSFDDWRPGDQQVYVSDIRKAASEIHWEPKVGVQEGLGNLVGWAAEHAVGSGLRS